ncbi:hypothetical protein JCM21900_002647 [Sporobolomyces salmonicolor]
MRVLTGPALRCLCLQKRASRAASDDDDDGSATDYDSPGPSTARRKSTLGKAASGRQRRKRTREDSDSSEGDSDDGGAAGKGRKGELSEAEQKHYIQMMVRYILFNEGHRRVLKREDIVKNVLTDGRGRHFNVLLPKAQKVLKDVMGMELVLLRAKDGATGKNPTKAWILRSTLPTPLLRYSATHSSPNFSTPLNTGFEDASRKSLRRELAAWEADEEALSSAVEEGGVLRDAKREEGGAYGVLGVILALILVNGKVLGDDQLISFLRRLQLYPSSIIPLTLGSPHPQHLTLSAYLALLTKQQYLERGKSGQAAQTGQTTRGRTQGPSRTQRDTADGVQESGDPSVEWRWGSRAEAEIGEEGVGKFINMIFESGSQGHGGEERGKTGEKLLSEVARAAGVKELQKAEEVGGSLT